jgi:(E)-4-hydroxy-3-methylbut-2-enyl-diphosphate synthase
VRKVTDWGYKDFKAIGHFYLPEPDKWTMNDVGADYIYSGAEPVDFMLPNGLKEIRDYALWQQSEDQVNKYPLFTWQEYGERQQEHSELNFLKVSLREEDERLWKVLREDRKLVVVLDTDNRHAMPAQRRFFYELIDREIDVPVIILRKFEDLEDEKVQLYAATDMGGLLIDGFGDGLLLSTELVAPKPKEAQLRMISRNNSISFGILQACRTRMSKTEYISCPSCGRTLFDLQETTAMIRSRTDHLKGVKIGIMGCIVNGPGEMADADYGYVGSGKGKITLYRGQDVVKRGVPSEQAVDELINIIREDGKWIEPQQAESMA